MPFSTIRVLSRLVSALPLLKLCALPKGPVAVDADAEITAEQIADAEAEALTCKPPTIAITGAEVDQYAIYDPESSEWVVTDFD